MVGRKSKQQATQLVHAHLQFLRAVDSVQDVMVRAARDAREAIARGDADAVYAVATVLRRMVKAIEVDEWLAQEVAKGRDWAFVGELLVMLNGAHAAESVKPNGGLTGIAQFMALVARDRTPVQSWLKVYDDLATIEAAMVARGLRLPAGAPLKARLSDLLRPVVTRRRGIGLEALRRTPNKAHPVPVLIQHVCAGLSVERLAPPLWPKRCATTSTDADSGSR